MNKHKKMAQAHSKKEQKENWKKVFNIN